MFIFSALVTLICLSVTSSSLTENDREDADDDDSSLNGTLRVLEKLDKEVCEAFFFLKCPHRTFGLEKVETYAFLLHQVNILLRMEPRDSDAFQKTKQFIDKGGPTFIKVNFNLNSFIKLHNYEVSEKRDLAKNLLTIEMILQRIEKIVYPNETNDVKRHHHY